MQLKKLLLLLPGLAIAIVHAQTTDSTYQAKKSTCNNNDSISLAQAIKKGKINAGVRYYFMHTNNAKGLSDYYANVGSITLGYQTRAYKNFSLGVGVYAIANLKSSDFSKPDTQTKQLNRYEVGLMDITDTAYHKILPGIDEFYIRFAPKKLTVTIGRQYINTPFINQQDGRMKPTSVEGLWLETGTLKNTKFNFSYLYRISPRSTNHWYSIAQSIGLYPQGVNTDGTKANYAGNMHSGGILLAGITHQIKTVKLQLWNQYNANIFNSLLVQADIVQPISNKLKIVGGVQFTYQSSINEGGNEETSKTYFTKGARAFAFSTNMGVEKTNWSSSINYTRITAAGRYLMPREWGRDPFYTFLPRERNEGFGDVNAVVAKTTFKTKNSQWQYSLATGYFNLLQPANFQLNKYGMPSYYQLNSEIRYRFKGLDVQLLYVYKKAKENVYNDRYVINKVNMSNFNAILQYRF